MPTTLPNWIKLGQTVLSRRDMTDEYVVVSSGPDYDAATKEAGRIVYGHGAYGEDGGWVETIL